MVKTKTWPDYYNTEYSLLQCLAYCLRFISAASLTFPTKNEAMYRSKSVGVVLATIYLSSGINFLSRGRIYSEYWWICNTPNTLTH